MQVFGKAMIARPSVAGTEVTIDDPAALANLYGLRA
jgi:hypothetical protein